MTTRDNTNNGDIRNILNIAKLITPVRKATVTPILTKEVTNTGDEELNNLCLTANIIRVIKSRMRWARHVARMGES